MTAVGADRPVSGLLRLPPEIRESIYRVIFAPANNSYTVEEGHKKYSFKLGLLRTNKQIYYEARRVFRRINTFVAVETPWEEAGRHVRVQGHVTLLIDSPEAKDFNQQHLTVRIDAPHFQSLERAEQRFVLHLDDLPKFCETWYYSDLTTVGLNANLRLTLRLQDPYTDKDVDSSSIPTHLQRRLLEPFGRVKALREVIVLGDHDAAIEKDMRDAMDVPHTSPEDCLEEATRLKDLGNAAVKRADYREALRLYVESFRAMHIVINGRIRSVWADPIFHQEMESGSYKGQHGQLVRLALRVKLVANVVQVYLKLEQYDEAYFWGMRSINLIREATQSDHAVHDFVAADQMGKIYYRTALASRQLGDDSEARQLLRTAVEYLPRDEIVRKEFDSLALRLG